MERGGSGVNLEICRPAAQAKTACWTRTMERGGERKGVGGGEGGEGGPSVMVSAMSF